MSKTIPTGAKNRAPAADDSFVAPNATAALTGELAYESAVPQNQQPIIGCEDAIGEAERELHQRVKLCLHQHGYRSHELLEINVERGVVVVQGRVPTFYLRQIAVECIKHIAGVTQLVDLIQVGDDLRQRQASVNFEDEQVSSASSMCHRMHL